MVAFTASYNYGIIGAQHPAAVGRTAAVYTKTESEEMLTICELRCSPVLEFGICDTFSSVPPSKDTDQTNHNPPGISGCHLFFTWLLLYHFGSMVYRLDCGGRD